MTTALIKHFVRQDLVDRHAGSALGALWTLLLPLANILIFTLIFSRIMGARLHAMGMDYLGNYSYSVYLITGLLAWNLFSTTVIRITAVFHDKAPLITKVNVSLFSLPVYIIVSEAVIYLISMAFFAVFLVLIGFNWTSHWLWLPVLCAIQQLLAYALGLLCAVLSVFFRDITHLVGVGVQLWFWLTPIVYVLDVLPPQWATFFRINPLFHTTQAFREALVMGRAPDWSGLGYVLLLGAVILAVAIRLGRHLEKDIRDTL